MESKLGRKGEGGPEGAVNSNNCRNGGQLISLSEVEFPKWEDKS